MWFFYYLISLATKACCNKVYFQFVTFILKLVVWFQAVLNRRQGFSKCFRTERNFAFQRRKIKQCLSFKQINIQNLFNVFEPETISSSRSSLDSNFILSSLETFFTVKVWKKRHQNLKFAIPCATIMSIGSGSMLRTFNCSATYLR